MSNINKKLRSAITALLTIAISTGILYAAWVMLTETSGNVMSIKAKHVEMALDLDGDPATEDPGTWYQDHPAFFDYQDLDPGLDQTFVKDFYLKSTKDLVESVDEFTIQVVGLTRSYTNGDPWDEVACPLGGGDDIAAYFEVQFAAEPAYNLEQLESTPIVFTWEDLDDNKTSNLYPLSIIANLDSVESSDCNNGAKVDFSIEVAEVIPPP